MTLVNFMRRRAMLLWQLSFLLLGTTWIWAPQLNNILSDRLTPISHYEVPGQPYAWLFQLGDVLAALLLGLMARYYLSVKQGWVGWLLVGLAVFRLLDPLLPTTCRVHGAVCLEYVSVGFVLHAIESTISSALLLVLSVYDAVKRLRWSSGLFVALQVAYFIFFGTFLAGEHPFNTLFQYLLQLSEVAWLAWFCRDFLLPEVTPAAPREARIVRYSAAGWGYLNGALAIVLSFYHINLLGHLSGLYVAGSRAWLAQHGVIVGVVMLYLSRHLARGELRARQIFLGLIATEVIKYTAVEPHPWLLAVYGVSFVLLFISRDDFTRGVVPMKLPFRLKEAGIFLAAILLTVVISLTALYSTHRLSVLTTDSIDHFFDYTISSKVIPRSQRHSVALARTFSAFLVGSLATLLWILFKPIKPRLEADVEQANDYNLARELLKRYSNSAEDYFKIWPQDKQFFWSTNRQGFIVYKLVGSVAFALPEPITARGQRSRLLKEFINWTRAHRYTACFLPVYTAASAATYKKADLQTFQVGSSAVIEVRQFMETTSRDKWWRWQKNRATKSGYEYHVSQPPHAPELLATWKQVSDVWLTTGGHEERSYALGYWDETYMQDCMVHFLTNEEGDVVAFTNQLPSFRPIKVGTVDLLRYQPSANNAMPFLLANTITQIGETKLYTHFDLGFVPFAATNEPLLKIAQLLAAGRFSAAGLEQFKNKFDPEWQPTYLAYDGDIGDLTRVVLNLERAMKVSE